MAESNTRPARKRVLRLAHLTDVHVLPERRAPEGLAACLRHIQGLADPPELILNGGDAVFEACNVERANAEAQADVWRRVLKAECSLPVEHCLGNHDIWGMDHARSHATGREKDWGKRWGQDLFEMKDRYRTFDRTGWRFIVLDSTFVTPPGYRAKLDEEQFAWLTKMLRETPTNTPVLVLSHIPILSACAYLDGENEKSGDWQVPGAWMHIDARRIKDLFYQHRNVKLCLSGHIHLVDRVDYLGVTYLCNGAVCAKWWKGINYECREGYGLVDLFDDGSFAHEYVEFGWQAEA